MPVTVHEISVQGLSGGIFWATTLAILFYVLGFATVGWLKTGSYWYGLWSVCSSSQNSAFSGEDWFKATQAMITIGLIFLIGCFLSIFLYMFVHSLSMSKSLLIKAFTIMAFAAVICMLIGLIIFGSKTERYGDLNWSYAFCCIGAIFSLIAGILAIVQMKQSNVV